MLIARSTQSGEMKRVTAMATGKVQGVGYRQVRVRLRPPARAAWLGAEHA